MIAIVQISLNTQDFCSITGTILDADLYLGLGVDGDAAGL
jgi:hypothetical protein